MSKVFMYSHGGSGNHGCEAIVRATCAILQRPAVLISSRPGEDRKYGVDELCELILERQSSVSRASLGFVSAYAALKLRGDFIPLEKLNYMAAFDRMAPGDLALSIGGDNYCYADVYRYTMMHEMAKRRGAKTVLWGCSVEPSLLEGEAIAADIASYDLIVSRETISYAALNAVNPNTVLTADPAFCMDAVPTELPIGFAEGNTVGINSSPLIVNKETVPGMAVENYRRLIGHILSDTDMTVALIPHVVWDASNDFSVLAALRNEFASPRVILADDCTAPELKYIISRCRYFVGARTHATIAAYSTCVPTLVVGYSVKARGIARDIFGTEENYVLPVQSLAEPDDLTARFTWLCGHEEEIRHRLRTFMPEYKQRAVSAGNRLRELIAE